MTLREYYKSQGDALDERRKRIKAAQDYVMECAEKLADGKATVIQLKFAVMDWRKERAAW